MKHLLVIGLLACLNSLYSQPVMDGTFDGVGTWGNPVAAADMASGWANANAKELYVVENGDYIYLGANITASDWMNWVFIIHTYGGGGNTDSWSRSIDYNHTESPDYVLRGTFGSYAEYHSWNGSSWSDVGTSISSSEFGENISGADQDGWVECRILKSIIGSPTTGDIQFYITGDQNSHGSFDAVPNDDNATSWDESSNRTPLDQYSIDVDLGGSPIVTITPSFPSASETITISFDASGTSLEGESKVYLHSGVSLTESAPQNFDKVVGNWGQDDNLGEMTSTGSNTWEITFTSINDYYSLNFAQDDVFGLNFLFRSADGSSIEDDSGNNYHYSVDPEDYFVINSPIISPFIVEINTNFDIDSEANNAPDEWKLKEVDPLTNNEISTLFTQSSGLTFSNTINHNTTDLKKYKIEADFGGTIKYKYIEVIAYGPINISPRPTWTKLGINYHSDDNSKATLVLHAPTYTVYKDGNGNTTGTNTTAEKEVIYVIGDFNNWKIDEAYKLNRDRDGWDGTSDADNDDDRGDYWWIELSDLVPGQEYVFQYITKDGLQIGDPYCHKVSDPDDQYIEEIVYSGLIDYPQEAIDRASVLQTNQTLFNWSAPSFTAPSTNELNIYELHFRDFTEEGTYMAATERLDYIKALGINAIHVMPVSEFEGNSSWGYNPNFYFAADKAYGTADDLKTFIDECHKREILVFNDLVLNHAFYSNVMAKMYWNEIDNKPANDNPWFNPDHKMVSDPAGWWGADWNHESIHTQKMMDDILDYWLQEFKFDGFRFDFTKGFGQTAQDPGDPWASSYDQNRIDLLERMIDGMWARNPGSIAIFEHLAWASENKVLGDYGILHWSGAGHHNQMKNWVLGYEADDPNLYNSGIYSSGDIDFTFANWISYPESHDEERLGYELSQYFNGPKTTETLINRMKLGLAFNMLFPGPRMIWQFEELGYDISINFNGRTGEKPVKWEYFEDDKRKELYRLLQKVFSIRNNYTIYATTPDYGNIGLGSNNITTPRKMRFNDGNGNYVIVIGNLDPNASHTISPDYHVTGTWYKYNGDLNTDGTSYQVNSTADTYTLNPSEVFILTNFEIDPCSHVINTKNDGYGSLRDAISCASSGDTIIFDYLIWNDTITLNAPITLDKNLYLLGMDQNITIDASTSTNLFTISSGNTVKISGLKLICGNAVNGRCLDNSGNLIIENVEISDSNGPSGSSIHNHSSGGIEVLGDTQIKH